MAAGDARAGSTRQKRVATPQCRGSWRNHRVTITRTSKVGALLAAAVFVAAACGGGGSTTAPTTGGTPPPAATNAALSGEINIDGSSTVYPITEAVAEEFQKANSGVKVTVAFAGTGGGFKKFCNGET